MAQPLKQISDELLFSACEQFLGGFGESKLLEKVAGGEATDRSADSQPAGKSAGAIPAEAASAEEPEATGSTPRKRGKKKGLKPSHVTRISEWLTDEGYSCSREQVYGLMLKGIKAGFMMLCPPFDIDMAEKMNKKYHIDLDKIHVLKVLHPTAHERLAEKAAQVIFELIYELSQKKERVHIGFAAGSTTQIVARSLSHLLRAEKTIPKLTIHAISSGFSVDRPETAPNAFFAFFHDLEPNPGVAKDKATIQYVGLFAPAVVKTKAYVETKGLPVISKSYDKRHDIDIVVTSLACMDDEHGLLSAFMKNIANKGWKTLKKLNTIGDVGLLPYSNEGPIVKVDTEMRTVTLFELDELVKMARTPGKHVVLVAGPCSGCGAIKTAALRPLLEKPNLRVFNHLVTDRKTALDVI